MARGFAARFCAVYGQYIKQSDFYDFHVALTGNGFIFVMRPDLGGRGAWRITHRGKQMDIHIDPKLAIELALVSAATVCVVMMAALAVLDAMRPGPDARRVERRRRARRARQLR